MILYIQREGSLGVLMTGSTVGVCRFESLLDVHKKVVLVAT